MNIEFKFNHGDYVNIKVFGLDYEGRVNRCIWDGNKIYSVYYAINGEIRTAEFYEDELMFDKEK